METTMTDKKIEEKIYEWIYEDIDPYLNTDSLEEESFKEIQACIKKDIKCLIDEAVKAERKGDRIEDTDNLFSIDKDVMGGHACFIHTRIPVKIILMYLFNGATRKELEQLYPQLVEHFELLENNLLTSAK